MTDGRHKLARAPGANDSSLHHWVARYVNHRSETTGNQNGVIVRGVDLRQLAAPIQPAERHALEKCLLSRIRLVVSIIGCPATRERRELNCDTRIVKLLKRVGDL